MVIFFCNIFCMQNMELRCVQLLMEISGDHSLEIVLCQVDMNELSECDQLKVYCFLEYDWCKGEKMVKFGRYFVQFVVWVGIPSSLRFGTDVVPKSRKSI